MIESNKRELLSRQMTLVQIILPLVIACIAIFTFYIQFNGADSPGGAFQSGIILASAIIAHDLVFSIATKNKSHQTLSSSKAKFFSTIGFLIYATTGLLPVFYGHNIFDYTAFHEQAHIANHYGLLGIETGVACTVFGSVVFIFNTFKKETNF